MLLHWLWAFLALVSLTAAHASAASNDASSRLAAYARPLRAKRDRIARFRQALDRAMTTLESARGPVYATVTEALAQLGDFGPNATLSSLGVDPYHRVQFDFRDGRGRVLEHVTEYGLTMLWNLYVTCLDSEGMRRIDGCGSLRTLMMQLLHRGMRADVPFYAGRHSSAGSYVGTPVGYSLANQLDVPMVEAMVRQGHDLSPTMALENGTRARDKVPGDPTGRYGFSYLHLISSPSWTNNLARTVFQFVDALRSGTPLHAVLLDSKVDRVYHDSPALQELFAEIVANASTIKGSAVTLRRLEHISSDLRVSCLNALVALQGANSPLLRELDFSIHDGLNPLIVAIVTGPSCAPLIRRFAELANNTKDWKIRAAFRGALLGHHARYRQGSAFHIAAGLHQPGSPVWSAMLNAAEVLWPGTASASLAELKDSNGKTPFEVLSSTVSKLGFRALSKPQPVEAFQGKIPNEMRCDVDVYDTQMTFDDFHTALARRTPFMIKGAMLGWDIAAKWELPAFIRKYGDVEMDTERIPYESTFNVRSEQSIRSTVKEFVAEWFGQPAGSNVDGAGTTSGPKYVFDGNILDENKPLRNDIAELLEFFADYGLSAVSKQFFLGPSFSGSPFHFHSSAVNFQVRGVKQWFLLSPNESFYDIKASTVFLTEDVPSLSRNRTLYTCWQGDGDVLVVPSFWSTSSRLSVVMLSRGVIDWLTVVFCNRCIHMLFMPPPTPGILCRPRDCQRTG